MFNITYKLLLNVQELKLVILYHVCMKVEEMVLGQNVVILTNVPLLYKWLQLLREKYKVHPKTKKKNIYICTQKKYINNTLR